MKCSDVFISECSSQGVNTLGTVFKGNTIIQYFNDYNNFTGITAWSSQAFEGCTSLKEVTLPYNERLATLPYRFFRGCSSLVKVVLPESITEIGAQAFYECSSLPSITIPSSVTYIERISFYRCVNLTKMIVLPTTPPGLYAGSGSNDFLGGVTSSLFRIYVPDSAVDTYRTASGWSYRAGIILPISNLPS